MEKFFILIICLLKLVISPLALAQKGYTISGTVEGIEAVETYAYLSINKNKSYQVIDSAKVKAGKFIFKGKVAEPNLYFLSIKDINGGILLMLDNAAVSIEGKANAVWQSTITGSPLAVEYKAYNDQYTNPAREELVENTRISEEYLAKGDSVNAQRYLSMNGQIMQQQFIQAQNYIATHPASFVSLHLLQWYWQEYGIERSRSYVQALSPSLQKHSITKALVAEWGEREELARKTAIGMPSMNFTQADTADQQINLASFLGKYVLVDFWASWCGPCRQESPVLVKAYKKYKIKGFEILSVSLDESKNKWIAAIHKDKLIWTHVSDLQGMNNEAALLYGVKSIPANFLLDPQGKIVATNLRGEDLESTLQQLFKAP